MNCSKPVKYCIWFVLLFTLFTTCRKQEENWHFTEKQIASLHLDKTTTLKPNTDSTIIVDLNPFLGKKTFDFGSLIDEVKLLPLETTDKSLVGGIYKVVATESNIYLMDKFKGKGLIIFNKEGKFVKRLSHGQGPGELYRLWDFSYDKENDKLIVYQHPFLMLYTSSGEYIKKQRLPLGFYNFIAISGGYLFKTLDYQGNEHLGDFKNSTLLITDKNFKIKSAGLNHLPFGKVLTATSLLHRDQDILSITETCTDTIFQYDTTSNQLKAKYIMDYSEKRLPKEFCFIDSYEKFHKITKSNDYVYFYGEYLETKTKNLFFLENNYNNIKTIVYRDKQTGNMKGGAHATFNWEQIPPTTFPISTYKDYFIAVHNFEKRDSLLLRSTIISDEDKEKIKKLKEDDKPILVFFKMKNF